MPYSGFAHHVELYYSTSGMRWESLRHTQGKGFLEIAPHRGIGQKNRVLYIYKGTHTNTHNLGRVVAWRYIILLKLFILWNQYPSERERERKRGFQRPIILLLYYRCAQETGEPYIHKRRGIDCHVGTRDRLKREWADDEDKENLHSRTTFYFSLSQSSAMCG